MIYTYSNPFILYESAISDMVKGTKATWQEFYKKVHLLTWIMLSIYHFLLNPWNLKTLSLYSAVWGECLF